MTTILILNGISLSTASAVMTTIVVRLRRRRALEAQVRPLYVTNRRA